MPPTSMSTSSTESDERSSTDSSLLDLEAASFLPESDSIDLDEKHVETKAPSYNFAFLGWTLINILATIGIVLSNKAIFSDPNLRSTQSTFAAFHFCVTGLTLYVASCPLFKQFTPVRAPFLQMLPLAAIMCLNVILPNLSLAFSSVIFYQTVRICLTPTVALLQFCLDGVRIPTNAVLTLIPLLSGVAIVVYFEVTSSATRQQSTSFLGVIFAFTGVIASSMYTIWIGSYQKRFELNSMQLLLNQAPLGVFLLLYAIPFTDYAPDLNEIAVSKWLLILLSGLFASLLNISQFFIVSSAGPVSSTVVGHLKTCSIVVIGWVCYDKNATFGGIFGVVLAISGIIAYTVIMYRHKTRSGLKA